MSGGGGLAAGGGLGRGGGGLNTGGGGLGGGGLIVGGGGLMTGGGGLVMGGGGLMSGGGGLMPGGGGESNGSTGGAAATGGGGAGAGAAAGGGGAAAGAAAGSGGGGGASCAGGVLPSAQAGTPPGSAGSRNQGARPAEARYLSLAQSTAAQFCARPRPWPGPGSTQRCTRGAQECAHHLLACSSLGRRERMAALRVLAAPGQLAGQALQGSGKGARPSCCSRPTRTRPTARRAARRPRAPRCAPRAPGRPSGSRRRGPARHRERAPHVSLPGCTSCCLASRHTALA